MEGTRRMKGQKERGTRRIAKGGTNEGQGGWRGSKGKRKKPRGLTRGPKRDQKDGGGKKEREAKRIAKGTSIK